MVAVHWKQADPLTESGFQGLREVGSRGRGSRGEAANAFLQISQERHLGNKQMIEVLGRNEGMLEMSKKIEDKLLKPDPFCSQHLGQINVIFIVLENEMGGRI